MIYGYVHASRKTAADAIIKRLEDGYKGIEVFSDIALSGEGIFALIGKLKPEDTVIIPDIRLLSDNNQTSKDILKDLYGSGANIVAVRDPVFSTAIIEQTIETLEKKDREAAKKIIILHLLDSFDSETPEGRLLRKDSISRRGVSKSKKDTIQVIIKLSKSFEGQYKDSVLIRSMEISRNTYYKYKQEAREQYYKNRQEAAPDQEL